MSDIDTQRFLYPAAPSLTDHPCFWKELDDPRDLLAVWVERLRDLQELLYADNRYSVLLVFQGMDTAGKDSTIEHVTSGVNPMGFQVFSFKAPSHRELDHNYLWRYWRAMPERGRIGVFNRSYYEEVGVVRVHPEIIAQRNLPRGEADDEFWALRMDDIRALERHLTSAGTLVLKFFLHVSKDEQRKRLIDRLDRPEKHWKFNPHDVEERGYWSSYQQVWDKALRETHTASAPWFVIPADHKRTMRVIVAQIVAERMAALDLSFPVVTKEQERTLEEARARLIAEDDS